MDTPDDDVEVTVELPSAVLAALDRYRGRRSRADAARELVLRTPPRQLGALVEQVRFAALGEARAARRA